MLIAKRPLGVVLFPAFDWSIGPAHPEREERLLYTQDQLKEEGLFDVENVREFKPDVAEREDVERVHFCFPDVESVATTSHMIAAGGAIKAGRLVMQKKVERAFALVRPPGHHAMKTVHGVRGFCAINVEAVMIERLREERGPMRVAIVDTDCHHGDGTQDIYWHDPNTLFISLHQDGRTLYPGTGFPAELGGPNARGRTINIPLPPGTGDEGYLYVIENAVLPILEDFKPDLIVNSAGQDNHYSDPLTDMNVTARGYAKLTERLGAQVAVLEGGYSIQSALPYVNLGICLAMAGLDYDHVREPDYEVAARREKPEVTDAVKRLADNIPKLYFTPPALKESAEVYTRLKDIWYDSDEIAEKQLETILPCGDCAGLLKVVSRSTRNPQSLGIEIPLGACDDCRATGYRVLEESLLKGGYRYVQFINRRDKDYQRFGY